jgi:hypothetical protein
MEIDKKENAKDRNSRNEVSDEFDCIHIRGPN